MFKVSQPLEYDSQHGAWEFNMPKTFKGIHSQAVLKVVIDPGYATGETGPIYTKNNQCGLTTPTITVKGYDNVSGWVSQVKFNLPELLEALIKLMPKDAYDAKTFILALNDLKNKEDEN